MIQNQLIIQKNYLRYNKALLTKPELTREEKRKLGENQKYIKSKGLLPSLLIQISLLVKNKAYPTVPAGIVWAAVLLNLKSF